MREINLRIVKWARTKISESKTQYNKGPSMVEINLPEATRFISHWSVGAQPTVE
jgi:hypothetical protein